MKFKKIAIVHDQLQEFGGAERVLVALKKIFPQADIYTSFYSPKNLGPHLEKFKKVKIKTSWADKISLFKKFYSPLRFITPWIWESFNFSSYDLVISSSGSYMAKGIITRPETIHICYLHHPPRYLYYYETAIEWQKYLPIKIYGHFINHFLRLWDYLSSWRVDYFIANSYETKKRIEKFYHRQATVIHPPVNIPKVFKSKRKKKNYYITVSRLAKAKHIEILIKAANSLKINLKIVGKGRAEKVFKKIAGPTIEFLGEISDKSLSKILFEAKAFLFASVDEEFGIAPVEAMGHGVPVIAYQSGGILDYLKEGKNGFLFSKLEEKELIKKIKLFEKLPQEKIIKIEKNARKTAEDFSFENFKKNFLEFIEKISQKSYARTS